MPSNSLSIGDLPAPPDKGGLSIDDLPTPKGKQASATVQNLAAAADTLISFPGQVVGTLVGSVQGVAAAAAGLSHEEVQQERKDAIKKYTEANPLNNPVHRAMLAAGYTEGYEKSDVSSVFNNLAGKVGEGGKWIEKATDGVIGARDFEDLTNSALMLAAPRAVGGAGKLAGAGLKKIAGKVDAKALEGGAKTLKARDDPTGDPAMPKSDATPKSLAKQHIEESQRIKAPEEQEAHNKARRADARAAFAEDPAYADYLKNYAEEEAGQRTRANEIAADKMEAEAKARSYDTGNKPVPEEKVGWNEVLPIMKKPGFQRSAEDLIKLRQFNKQGGRVDPKVLGMMAAVGIGVTAGLNLDPEHPISGALMGAISGYLGGKGLKNIPKAGEIIKSVFKADTRIRMTEIGDTWDSSVTKAGRSIWQKQMDINDLVATTERRAAVTKWMQGNKNTPLTDAEYRAALKAKDFFRDMGEAGVSSGVLSHLIPDYVTNLWDLEGANKAAWEKLSSGPGMSGNSRFNLQRKITSIEEGKKLGLKPVTEDITQIMGIYGNALSRTMANRQLITSLTSEKVAGTKNTLLMPKGAAPKNYVPINHPQMQGKLVHPDIAKSMDFLFQQKSPSGIRAGIEGLNSGVKRMAVSFSLFHAKALTDAYIGAGGNPLKLGGMAAGTSKYLKMLREGGAGDLVDKAYDGGLKFTLDKGALAVEDVGSSFYHAMESARGIADEIVPGAGKLVKGFEDVNHAVDTLMWSRLHAGMKLEVFASKLETLRENNVKAHEANPDKVTLKTEKELAQISASFTNDLFGGLNWRMAAENAKTKWGRDAALTMYSPAGRRGMQLLMFAPDWTISTTRAALGAFGKGSVKGVIKPETLGDLHRQYVLRSAAYYAIVGGALNYAMSGHYLDENKDPTVLELGDGRTMQFSKHAMEPVHWLTKPTQQALGKLGVIPSEFAEQVAGVEYLTAKGKAPTMDTTLAGRTRHLMKRAVPFAAGQGEGDLASGVAGSLGFPIYGKTAEQKEKDKETAAEKRKRQKEEVEQ